jgi:dolichol-phosphate mannosyltransferase
MSLIEIAVPSIAGSPGPAGEVPRSASAVVLLPTYNEAGNIGRALSALLTVDARLEIAVIDDASPDGTADIAEAVGSEHPGRVHVLRRPGKDGLGSAYRFGFAWAIARGYELVIQMDADGSHPAERLPAMIGYALGGAGLVIGSRYTAGGATEGWARSRRALSRGANAYARTVLGLHARDTTGGFRVWRREALDAARPETTTTSGYGFLVEMLVAAERASVPVVEVPITFVDRTLGESKMTRDVAFEAARKLWSLRRRGLRLHPGKELRPVWA